MSLTELQLPGKDTFYVKMQDAANRMNKVMDDWSNLADFIGWMDAGDLDAMGVPTGQLRTDLTNFRTALTQILSLWEGNAVPEPTLAPVDAADKIRFMY